MCLAAAAPVALVHLLILGTSAEDAEALESPLALAAARQITAGPFELYGPYGGANPYVLIHAPLYYRATGLVALALVRAGLDPIPAAFAAGRSISFLAFLGTLFAVYRLARLEGGSRSAGWWAVFLVASAPVIVSMPVAVRPDMLGIWCQTTAVWLVLGASGRDRAGDLKIAAALALFALAVCVKQHFVASGLVCAVLLLVRSRRGSVRRAAVERGLLLGAAIVFLVYGAEEVVTAGWMASAIVTAATAAASVHPTTWHGASIVAFAFLGRSLGLVAMLIGLGAAWVDRGAGPGRRAFAAVAGSLMAAVLAVSVWQYFDRAVGQVVFQVIAILSIVFVALPICAILERRFLTQGPADAVLLVLIAAELGVAILLCRASTGAWINYGIQATVFLGVLIARALDRAWAVAEPPRRLRWIALFAVGPLVSALAMLQYNLSQRAVDLDVRLIVIAKTARPASEFFFVDRPGVNRRNGRPDLVFDEWLYPVFERIKLAEPRSSWLKAKLSDGTVGVVVNTNDGPGIEGVVPSLARLGFVRRISIEPLYYVWERPAYAKPPVGR